MNSTEKKHVFPLLQGGENEVVTILELKGGQHFKEKCINQGIIPGREIKIINNSGNGPCLILINNVRLMIGRGMLNRIYVMGH
jgi:Fe2+ transport system protein FeoA